MGLFDWFRKPQASQASSGTGKPASQAPSPSGQEVEITWKWDDSTPVEDEDAILRPMVESLEALLAGGQLGSVEGYDIEGDHASLLLRGPDAEAIWSRVRELVRGWPLPGARVRIAAHGHEREVAVPG